MIRKKTKQNIHRRYGQNVPTCHIWLRFVFELVQQIYINTLDEQIHHKSRDIVTKIIFLKK